MHSMIFAAALLITGSSPADETLSFSTDVQPILTKLGCNQGACHGSQYGKGGFKLSLRGFDDPADYFEIVKASKGRRIVLGDPELSLFIAKPSMKVPHQGGKKLIEGSSEYKTLLRWVEQGSPAPAVKEPQLKELFVSPAEIVAKPGARLKVAVTAKFDDGLSEDVSDRASFDSSSPAVAAVDAAGQASIVGKGEAVVMVRYLDRVGVCRLVSPYQNGDIKAGADFKPRNLIDERWLAKWKQLGLSPTTECTDAEFFRRIHLDTLGIVPQRDEVEKFLADKRPDKRDRAIEAVLARPEYVDYWTNKWGDLLRNNRNLLQEKGMWAMHQWLRSIFRDNVPMDRFVGELLTASGSPYQEGPANFYRVGRQPEDWAENAAQVFLGVRMQCARCHHHPFENISQQDYYGMTAFFTRVGTKRSMEFGLQSQDSVVYVREAGEARHPRTGQIVKPKPLGDGGATSSEEPDDRRRILANWLADRSNPALAKNIVNRYWGYYFGRGLVHPIDDLRVTNPASCPELFDELAKDLIAHDYDVKRLLRLLMQSRVYQSSSEGSSTADFDSENKYFTHYTVKRLSAEQLLDAVDSVCGTQERFNGLPEGYRACTLPDTSIPSRFLDAFGRPRREIACECERTDSPNMAQALQLLTGSLLNAKVQNPQGRIGAIIKKKAKPEEAVRELYFASYCRPPSDAELKAAASLVGQAPNLKEGLEDLLWAMLNSREFQFVH
jgi:hypothetical protein